MNIILIHVIAAVVIAVALLLLYCVGFGVGVARGERNALPEVFRLTQTNNALKSENAELDKRVDDLEDQLDQALHSFNE